VAPPGPQGTASGAVEAGTVARVAAVAALALAVVIVAVVVLGGSGGKTYYIDFQNAGQLVKGDDVQVGGRRIGSVNAITLTNHNLARIKVTINDSYAPLHQGTTALVRATSLSGIANRYIALTPGPRSVRTARRASSISTSSSTRSTPRRARRCRTSFRVRRRSTRARGCRRIRARSTSGRRSRAPIR
jgi:ABC-type transporter Mla subunit MlaD